MVFCLCWIKRESGSGNTDVEVSSSPQDSAGWEASSDWSDWNLPGGKKSGKRDGPSSVVERSGPERRDSEEMRGERNGDGDLFFFFFP